MMMMLETLLLSLLCSLVLAASDIKHKDCPNPLPGFRKMVQGIDLLTFDVLDSSNRKRRLFEITCDSGRTEQYAGETWDRPDQIHSFNKLHKSLLNNTAEIIKTESDVQKASSKSVTVEAKFGQVAASHSREYSRMMQAIDKDHRFFTRREQREERLGIDLVTPKSLILDTEFKQAIEDLPLTRLETEDDPYLQVIRTYGTHYISQATLGGLARVESSVDESYLDNNSERDLNTAFSIAVEHAMYGRASIGHSDSESDKKKSSEFKKYSSTYTMAYGGNTNVHEDGIKKWQPTVKTNLETVAVELKPIYDLLKYISEEKSDQMEKAVNNYLQPKQSRPATLEDLERRTHIETGTFTAVYLGERWDNMRHEERVTFRKPYDKPPKVTLAMTSIACDFDDMIDFRTKIIKVTRTGVVFEIKPRWDNINIWNIHFTWTSFPN